MFPKPHVRTSQHPADSLCRSTIFLNIHRSVISRIPPISSSYLLSTRATRSRVSGFYFFVCRFLDRTGYTGSTAQWINGVVLLSTFFSCRIVYGWYITLQFMEALYSARAELPKVYLVAFGVGNLALNTLNIIWCATPITLPPSRCPLSMGRLSAIYAGSTR